MSFTGKTGGFESYDSYQLLCSWKVEANSKPFRIARFVRFTVRFPKCRSDDKHHKKAKNNDDEAFDSILQIGHHLGSNGVK